MASSTLIVFFAGLPALINSLQAKDFIDVAVAAFLIYLILIFIKQSRSYFVVSALVLLASVNFLGSIFNLSLTRQIVQPVLTFFIVIVVIVFQREIRRFFEWFSFTSRRLAHERKQNVSEGISVVIARALLEMAKRNFGAIIVLEGEYPLDNVTEGGFPLDGRISIPLLLSIFDPTSPGHDGAVIIDNHRIRRFGVHLPLAENFDKFSKFGTRHRAAVGITEKTDALALVVSEEKGTVSYADSGKLITVSEPDKLEKIIEDFLKEGIHESHAPWKDLLAHNLWHKLGAICLSIILWFTFVYQTGVTTQQIKAAIEFRSLPSTLVIENTDIHEVSLTISGNYRDFRGITPNNIKVVVDLSEARAGTRRYNISKENITLPSYFTLTSIQPKSVRVITVPVPQVRGSRDSS